MSLSTIDEKTSNYKRSNSSHRSLLNEKIAKLYGSELCEMTCSGTTAVYLVLRALFEYQYADSVFLVSDQLYSGSNKIIRNFAKEYPHVKVLYFDPSKLDIMIKNTKNIGCIFFESASN